MCMVGLQEERCGEYGEGSSHNYDVYDNNIGLFENASVSIKYS